MKKHAVTNVAAMLGRRGYMITNRSTLLRKPLISRAVLIFNRNLSGLGSSSSEGSVEAAGGKSFATVVVAKARTLVKAAEKDGDTVVSEWQQIHA